MRTQPSFARVLLLGFSLFAAGCADFHLPVVSNGPSPLYSVTASSTAFYSHSPRQGTPDQEIPRDTLVRLARYSPSFAKVTLVDGQEGYVATNDIAPSAHTAAATVHPPIAQVSATPPPVETLEPALTSPEPPLPDVEPPPLPGTADAN